MENNIDYHQINNVTHTTALANDLKRFVNEKKLFHNIQGKQYVNVEGWQYAGIRLGYLPICEKPERLESEDKTEIKYSCFVELFCVQTKQKVGSGYAVCSNREPGKRSYQEFAVCSMAQTRAVGKAYRNMLAWIIRAAGYEPTPLEEMDDVEKQEKQRHGNSSESKRKKPAAGDPALTQAKGDKIVMATVKQKTELLLLLQNKYITSEEKNRMVESINKLDSERCGKSIEKVKKIIEERIQAERIEDSQTV